MQKKYILFKRMKNIAYVMLKPKGQRIDLCVRVNPDTITLEEGFTRNMRDIANFGALELEIILKNKNDLEKAKPFLRRAYDNA